VSKRGGPVLAGLRKGARLIRTQMVLNLHQHLAASPDTTGLLMKSVIVSRGKAPFGTKGERVLVRIKRRTYPGTGEGTGVRASAVLAKVNAEARSRILLALLALGLAGGCARAANSVEVLQAFAEGHTAYAGRDFARSREAFRRASSLAPRDAAVWANLGSAAWAARDTATAVLGWQRALRLDPTSSDVRERLARVPAPQHRGAARVWAVSPLPVLALGLVLWVAGWGWAYAQTAANRHSRWPLVALLAALVCLGTGAWLDTTLAARDLVVLAEPAPLRALPALGADPGAMPITGEIARVTERRGVWLRLELDGGRAGWYPAERVFALARD
jgi:hypothetical protein